MVEYRVFPNRIDSYLVKRMVLEVYAVTAAEYLGIFSALQVFVDQQAAIRSGRQTGFFKDG